MFLSCLVSLVVVVYRLAEGASAASVPVGHGSAGETCRQAQAAAGGRSHRGHGGLHQGHGRGHPTGTRSTIYESLQFARDACRSIKQWVLIVVCNKSSGDIEVGENELELI